MAMHFGTRTAIAFPLALLFLLALMTYWINKSTEQGAPKLDGSHRHDPDYIINNFVSTQTDANGHLSYKLSAVEMRHYPDDDTAELTKPNFIQFELNKPHTIVESERGKVFNEGEKVDLFDNVKATRVASADKGEMSIETDYLNIIPDKELVSTPNPVVIRQAPKTVVRATGMIYDKKKRTLTLLHKVRAHYEKPIAQTKKNSHNTASKTNKKVKASQVGQPKNNTRIRRIYE